MKEVILVLFIMPVVFVSLIVAMNFIFSLLSRVIHSRFLRVMTIFLLYIAYIYITLSFSYRLLGFYSYTYLLETFIAFFFLPKLGKISFLLTPLCVLGYCLTFGKALAYGELQISIVGISLFLLSLVLSKANINAFIKIFIALFFKLVILLSYPFVFTNVYVSYSKAIAIFFGSVVVLLLTMLLYLINESEIQSNKEKLHRSTLDALTGVYNFQKLGADSQKYELMKQQYALVMIDLDYFKKVNDTFGHSRGNVVLRTFADQLRSYLSHHLTTEQFEIYRFGGEEFCVLLFDISVNEAYELIDSFRIEFANYPIAAVNRQPITFSAGITTNQAYNFSGGQTMDDADTALYQAKDLGRNRICIFKEN